MTEYRIVRFDGGSHEIQKKGVFGWKPVRFFPPRFMDLPSAERAVDKLRNPAKYAPVVIREYGESR